MSFCKPFWTFPSLEQRRQDLEDNTACRSNLENYVDQEQLFFHEMTHLNAISGGGENHNQCECESGPSIRLLPGMYSIQQFLP